MLDEQEVRSFIEDKYGVFKYNSYKRLLATLRHLGFLGRYGSELASGAIVTAEPGRLRVRPPEA